MAGSEVRVAIVADNSDLSRTLKDSQSKLASFGKTVGKAALVAGGAAAAGITALAVTSVKSASDAQQSMGATETVFGKHADSIIKASGRAANAVGLSGNAYRESSNKIGALLGNQGVSSEKLVGKTKSLIKTGADLAATFGGPASDAVDALASALKGEFDPLEAYGISIKQSTINTEAYRVANVKSKKEFDALSTAQQGAAKSQAAMNLINKQSSKSQGAFAKETNTFAHQQQVLGANFENLKVKIGTALLPVLTKFFQYLNAEVTPVVMKLADQYLPRMAKSLGDLVDGFSDPGAKASEFGDALKGVDWDDVATSFGEIGDSLKELGPALKEVSVDTIADGFSVFGAAVGFAADHVDTLKKALPYLTAALVAYKSAQLLNNIVGKDSLIGFGLQLAMNRSLIASNRELAASIGLVNGAQSTSAGGIATTTSKLSKLAGAAKLAAGAGGVLALTAGVQESNTALSTLETTAGGVATGFAVGGPIGAAIGGLGGLVFSLGTKFDYTGQAGKDAYKELAAIDPVKVATDSLVGLKDSLDQVTGAYTENTRAAVLKKLSDEGLIATGEKYGISARTMIDAALGQSTAWSQISPVIASYKQKVTEADAAQAALAADFQNFDDAGFTPAAQARYTALEQEKKAAQAHIAELQKMPGVLRADAAEIRANSAATADYTGKLKGLPKAAKTEIRAEGVLPTTRAIAKLTEKYRLNPKQIKTLIEATGADTTVGKVQKVTQAIKDAKKAKPDLKPAVRAYTQFALDSKREAIRGATGVSTELKKGTGKAKANLGPFKTSIKTGVTSAKGTASSGGAEVGGSLKSGVLAGVSGLGDSLSAAVSGAVRAAIAAGKAEADAHSPSRKMHKLGQDIAQGLVNGMDSGRQAVARSGAGLSRTALKEARAVVTAVRNINFGAIPRDVGPIESRISEQLAGAATRVSDFQATQSRRAVRAYRRQLNTQQDELRASLRRRGITGKKADRILDRRGLSDKDIDKKVEKRETRRANADKRRLKTLDDERAKLLEIGRQQDANNLKLEAAREELTRLKDESAAYADNIKQAFVSFANIVGLGVEEDQTVNYDKLLEQLTSRANDAERFANLMRTFQGMGLSQQVIDQIVAAGPEGGLATLEALASGVQQYGQRAIDDINRVTTAITNTGGTLGDQLADAWYGHGIKAAAGLVAGLESEQARLNEAAETMGEKFADAVASALGIRSPSTVMAGLGEQAAKGLAIGVDSTYVTRAGAGMANSLVKSFGEPQLTANAVYGTAGGTQITVTLTAQQVSQLERGRQITMDIDAYRAAGGRSRT